MKEKKKRMKKERERRRWRNMSEQEEEKEKEKKEEGRIVHHRPFADKVPMEFKLSIPDQVAFENHHHMCTLPRIW